MQFRILTWRAFRRRKNPEAAALLFPRNRLRFLFLAPSGENANLNYGLVHISPQKNAGKLGVLFAAKPSLGFFFPPYVEVARLNRDLVRSVGRMGAKQTSTVPRGNTSGTHKSRRGAPIPPLGMNFRWLGAFPSPGFFEVSILLLSRHRRGNRVRGVKGGALSARPTL